jgi:hypothetical protein
MKNLNNISDKEVKALLIGGGIILLSIIVVIYIRIQSNEN